MDGLLIYFKSKSKKQLQRCAIKPKDDQNKNDNFDKFVIYNKDQKSIKKVIPFEVIKMIARYEDGSWSIVTKSGNTYRYLDDNLDRNEMWLRLLKGENIEEEASENERANEEASENEINDTNVDIDFIDENTQQHDDEISSSNHSKIVNQEEDDIDFSNANLDQGIQVRIEPEKTDKKFLNIFSLDYIYELKMSLFELTLYDTVTNREYVFQLERIKRYGSFPNCFLFELGRNLEYGPGKIALKSFNHDTLEFYDIVYDLFTEKLARLKERIIEYCYENKINSAQSNAIDESDMVIIESENLVRGGDNQSNNVNLNENANNTIKTEADPSLLNSKLNIVTYSKKSGENNDVEIPITIVNGNDDNNKISKSVNENFKSYDYDNSASERIVIDNHNNRFEFTLVNDYSVVEKNFQTNYKKIINTRTTPLKEESNVEPNSEQNETKPKNDDSDNVSQPKNELKLLEEHPNLESTDSDTSTLVETDESFYMDKYKPEYMNKKLELQSNVFLDRDNSLYGRVKL